MKEKKQVGIFIRVSTDLQVKDESPETHIKRAEMYAESRGWEVAEIYRLDGVSGKSIIEQPVTKQMLTDVKRGHISGLVFSKLARIARNNIELLQISKYFQQHNADLISLSESIDTSTPAGRFFFALIAALAEWEREEISSRAAASVPIRAQLGRSLGGAAPFGYVWKHKKLVIDEAEAAIRRRMYDIFKTERRIKTTADLLNAEGHRTRSNEQFSANTIHRLLRDPLAKGERRVNYTKSHGKGKHWEIKPSSEWVMMPCPPIISETLWNECNAILDEIQQKHTRTGRKAFHLLTGYVRCHCGEGMYITHQSNNYVCKGCKNRIAGTDVDEIYHAELKHLLTVTDADQYRARMAQELVDAEALFATTTAEREKIVKELQQLVDMRYADELDKEGFQELYKPKETRLKQIAEGLPKLQADIDYRRVQSLSADTVVSEANTLAEQWDSMDFQAKRNIVETITNYIVIGTDSVHIAFRQEPAFSQKAGHNVHTSKDS